MGLSELNSSSVIETPSGVPVEVVLAVEENLVDTDHRVASLATVLDEGGSAVAVALT